MSERPASVKITTVPLYGIRVSGGPYRSRTGTSGLVDECATNYTTGPWLLPRAKELSFLFPSTHNYTLASPKSPVDISFENTREIFQEPFFTASSKDSLETQDRPLNLGIDFLLLLLSNPVVVRVGVFLFVLCAN